jgi:hypothetical protein
MLDANLNENSKLIVHLADLSKHRFYGSAHPFYIHKYPLLGNTSKPLGYELV